MSNIQFFQERLDAATQARETVEQELLRVRTTQAAAAHALDVLRQDSGLDLIDGEHPASTAARILGIINTLRTMVDGLPNELRKYWSFNNGQQHTHSWHTHEDFIELWNKQLEAAKAQ